MKPQLPLGSGAATLLEQLLVVIAVVVVVMVAASNPKLRRWRIRAAAACAICALAVALGVGEVGTTASVMSAARKETTGRLAGLEHCYGEEGFGDLMPFIDWVKRRLPAKSVYDVDNAPGSLSPTEWCLTTTLLPSIPADHSHPAGWAITLAKPSPALRSRIAAGGPSVRIFAPGYVLVRLAR